MGRGLDGLFITHIGLVRFSSSTEASLAKFRWRIARGKHLFPFRTEQLSPSAPMVLGGQPPGRVGRCRFLLGPPFGAALFLAYRRWSRILVKSGGLSGAGPPRIAQNAPPAPPSAPGAR